MVIRVEDKSSACLAIKAIGEELIARAEDITKDLDRVVSIKIEAEINAEEIVNFNIIKNYIANIDKDNNKEKNTK